MKKIIKSLVVVNIDKKKENNNIYKGLLRKGDVVRVTVGKYKGIEGKVLEINRKKSKIRVEGVNVKKLQNENTKSLPPKEMFISVSNVMYYSSEYKGITRLKMEDGKRYMVKFKKEI